MLSSFEEKIVWDSMLGAEIRAQYFAALSTRYRGRQFWLSLSSFVLSSGAFFALVTTVVPAKYGWIKPTVALMAACLSGCSLLAKNERNSIDSADLHFRWNQLAIEYRRVWTDVSADDARTRLQELEREEATLSKSSTAFPEDLELMAICEDNVVMHHQNELVPA
jgi:hypothetical protein